MKLRTVSLLTTKLNLRVMLIQLGTVNMTTTKTYLLPVLSYARFYLLLLQGYSHHQVWTSHLNLIQKINIKFLAESTERDTGTSQAQSNPM